MSSLELWLKSEDHRVFSSLELRRAVGAGICTLVLAVHSLDFEWVLPMCLVFLFLNGIYPGLVSAMLQAVLPQNDFCEVDGH